MADLMEAPLESGFVNVFELWVAGMDNLFQPGSYRKVLLDILMGIKSRAEWEHHHPDESGTNHPNSLEGKPALPSSKEYFIVRVTSTTGNSVCFLFEWSTLYNVAFYVDTVVEAQQCWYIYKDYARTIRLPPTAQFNYVRQQNAGFHVLDISGSYASLGRKCIRLGPGPIDGYIRQLFTIRNRLQVGDQLVLNPGLRSDLMQGAVSFAAVVISEPSRFGQYKNFMIQSINYELEVPKKYTDLFTIWSALSMAISKGKEYTLNQDGQKVHLNVYQVQRLVCVLCKSVYTLG